MLVGVFVLRNVEAQTEYFFLLQSKPARCTKTQQKRTQREDAKPVQQFCKAIN